MSEDRLFSAPGRGKKRILIIEDRQADREVLGRVLGEPFEILYAATGAEALSALRAGAGELSLALMDLELSDMGGLELLKQLREEKALASLPVIVLTADQDDEVESLAYGAIDFIPKPYPRPEVILARVMRTIELFEGRVIIGQTERDQLTGLYNPEYFYRYAEQFDLRHPDAAMDAIVIDVNHFHLFNERYGRAYGDEVLKRIGGKLRAVIGEDQGIVCRRLADTFLAYCVHRPDYTTILEAVSEGAAGEGRADSIVRLRMGVYSRVDRSLEIERRFDRAKLASDTVRSTFTKAVAIYDSALHESAMFAEQLMEDFQRGAEDMQFQVFYQPKYDVRGERPLLVSAEALVRWRHPEFGMLRPDVFVPLFESNGLIERLDRYVWREAARQVKDWKARLGYSVPVSVNVSRIDIADAGLVEHMQALVDQFGLEPRDLLLEITESAYTQDSDRIVETVDRLRRAGFHIEMDDFGSGYSSLNMLTSLPIDTLKLDMQFIRNAFKNGKNTRMLEVVLEIADSLCVPVVAEGVETAEQMFTLKAMGCDIVQGYYFSRPVPAREFEKLLAGQGMGQLPPQSAPKQRKLAHDRHTYGAMHDALTGLYNNSAFDILLYDADMKHTALMIADVDGFDAFLASGGQALADSVILKVTNALRENFRASDFICRIREDEFAVILTRVDSTQRDVILGKVVQTAEQLRRQGDDLPSVTLSAGIAFGDRNAPRGDIFQDADEALNRAKRGGGMRCEVYLTAHIPNDSL